MGFCAMFPAEKSAMSSAVVLLSSVISAIPHLPRSLTTPLGDVRSPSVYRDGHQHACRIDPSLHVTAAPPRVGSLHRTPPVLRIIPEHQRGLHTGEASEVCHGFTPPKRLMHIDSYSLDRSGRFRRESTAILTLYPTETWPWTSI